MKWLSQDPERREKLIDKIISGRRPSLAYSMPEPVYKITSRCMYQTWDRRPSTSEVATFWEEWPAMTKMEMFFINNKAYKAFSKS